MMSEEDKHRRIYERMDKKVLQSFVEAKLVSQKAGLNFVHTESFIVGILISASDDITVPLIDMGVDINRCTELIANNLEAYFEEDTKSYSLDSVKASKAVLDVCQRAHELSLQMRSKYIGTWHVFVSLLEKDQKSKAIMESQGFSFDDFMRMPNNRRSKPAPKAKKATKPANSLKTYCSNVTELARQSKLDPIIARDKEIEEAVTILCRRSKNNPMFIGEPGVGKTAVVEGIAQRIASGAVPKKLQGCTLYSLSLSNLVAGTKYRGEFEERIQELIEEIKSDDKCIIFIDEIHTIVGAGSAAGGSMDASNILKPFLARGEIRCIGATTNEDYKKYFEKDGALVRRFQQIPISEPDEEQVAKILYGVRMKLEEFHKCTISDDAIDAAISLSGRYMPSKNFPDKAIDCLDTACAQYVWGKLENDEDPVINADDVANVVSKQCQIPIEVILWDDNERIMKIQEALESKVVGQDPAVKIVCQILKNAYSGVRDPNRPIGSFVFGGQSGTGKTYLSKELAKAVFGKDNAFIRLDMSEYCEPSSVNKLIGSPPGYVGFSETEVFLDKVKRRPYCIVLLDEIEKAHPTVMKLFLQVMAEGTMTDSIGAKVDFKNVIIIMTGNFGMNEKMKSGLGFGDKKDLDSIKQEQERLVSFCSKAYGVEFINRVDEFVPFVSLSDKDLTRIARMELQKLCERLSSRHCKLSFSNKVYTAIAEKSKKEHGKNANILGRIISKQIQPCVADALLSFGVNEGKEIHVEINVNKEGDFFCSKKKTVAKKSATKKKSAKKKATKKATKKAIAKKTAKKSATKKKTDSQKTTRKVSKKRSPVRKKPSKDS
jgi:ATP-dependent Clp protease ATP-binding subunit ClpC